MSWRRIIGYGVLLWLAPFLVSCALIGVRQANRPLFESLITVFGVACAVVASVFLFKGLRDVTPASGLGVGLAWAAISIAVDLPIFLGPFHMPFAEYLADIALSYLSFPLITTGIAVATSLARSGL